MHLIDSRTGLVLPTLTISEWNHQFWFTVPLLLKNCKVDRQDRISLPDFSHKAINAVRSVFKLCCPLINDKRCTNLCELVGGNFISKLIWRKGRKAGTYRSLQMQIIGLCQYDLSCGAELIGCRSLPLISCTCKHKIGKNLL